MKYFCRVSGLLGSVVLIAVLSAVCEAEALPQSVQVAHPVAQRENRNTDNNPQFAVSTVKPTPKASSWQIQFDLDTFTARGATVRELVEEAFGIDELDRIVGGPSWADTERFDVDAKVDVDAVKNFRTLNLQQRRKMLLDLLTQRFGLSIHHEDRVFPVYALVVAKGGEKLKKSSAKSAPANAIDGYDGLVTRSKVGFIEVEDISMAGLAKLLGHEVQMPVVDRTNLSGHFDLSLHWTPDRIPVSRFGLEDQSIDTSWPTLRAAVKEELGLMLQPTHAPVDTIVIDRLELPTEN